MAENQDQHTHRNLETAEAPLDAANQSLADALRASFRILKGIMCILVILYLFSNVRRIESHEQALVLRLGQLKPEPPHEAGLVWAFPFPIDEIVPLPTRKSNELAIDSHSFKRRRNEIGKPLSFIARGPTKGLHPVLDGALMTSDAGLVHVRWKAIYKIDDVSQYVSRVIGKEVEAAENLILKLVENAGIKVASELTAEELIRTRVDYVQQEMKRRVNEKLTWLKTGITLSRIEMHEPTPPITVRVAFDSTQQSENRKQKKIREAEQQRTKILNEAAGAAYVDLLRVLDELELAKANHEPTDQLQQEVDQILTHRVEGEAGRAIKDVGAYLSQVVGLMQSDVEMYRTLLPEYQRNPHLLIARLWEDTKRNIFSYGGVTKIYRPSLATFRLNIPLDPEATRVEEALRLQEQKFDPSKLRKERYFPVGWEYD